ncbi:Gfo/Idh/MocA family oxidoreductase [Luteipulveratus sp. YIM 133132]|uniref:Gfo/Idh/MocA family protein n=1 Tax=Luteipulveratus flavus TaxID=3031728 RepID=UPI0023AF524F|nr:Gfo/Idh/MocA family oxidoreductase [Luteipulveratus sp. YIM 133132]MDE9367064.1 Gfo/Idh/MocA family oxidoreductase [Luteipulveratus sp. YIM 133132]
MRIGLVGVGRIGAFHASTLLSLDAVDALVISDADQVAAKRVAAELGAEQVADVDTMLASGVDGLVIAAATPAHAPLLRQALAAQVPTFCEKPVARTLDETLELARLEAASAVPVHIGFQRRFDAGYREVRRAIGAGELGFVHTIRANTHDEMPPHASYIPTSGGIFRDCNVHDFDAIRFVTGQEVESAYATGGNQGERFFVDAGDVDTGAALLRLVDGTTCLVSSTRYNGAGHDVRLEAMGSRATLAAGLDDSLAMRSAEEGMTFPPGPVHRTFMDRFLPAYVAELTAFADVVRGERPSPCTVADALQAFRVAEACDRSWREGRVVPMSEVPDR